MTSSDVQDPSIQIPALQMCENKFGTHQNMEFRRATITMTVVTQGCNTITLAEPANGILSVRGDLVIISSSPGIGSGNTDIALKKST